MGKRKRLIIASVAVGSIVLAAIIGLVVKSCCCSKGSGESPKGDDSSPTTLENSAGIINEELFGDEESELYTKRARPSNNDYIRNFDNRKSDSGGVLKDVVFGKDGAKKVVVIDNPNEYIGKIFSCAEMPNPLLNGCSMKSWCYFDSQRLDESFSMENCSLLIGTVALRGAEMHEESVLAHRIFKNMIDMKQFTYHNPEYSYKQLMIQQNPLCAEFFNQVSSEQISAALNRNCFFSKGNFTSRNCPDPKEKIDTTKKSTLSPNLISPNPSLDTDLDLPCDDKAELDGDPAQKDEEFSYLQLFLGPMAQKASSIQERASHEVLIHKGIDITSPETFREKIFFHHSCSTSTTQFKIEPKVLIGYSGLLNYYRKIFGIDQKRHCNFRFLESFLGKISHVNQFNQISFQYSKLERQNVTRIDPSKLVFMQDFLKALLEPAEAFNPQKFVSTYGTHVVIELCLDHCYFHFDHISSDESFLDDEKIMDIASFFKKTKKLSSFLNSHVNLIINQANYHAYPQNLSKKMSYEIFSKKNTPLVQKTLEKNITALTEYLNCYTHYPDDIFDRQESNLKYFFDASPHFPNAKIDHPHGNSLMKIYHSNQVLAMIYSTTSDEIYFKIGIYCPEEITYNPKLKKYLIFPKDLVSMQSILLDNYAHRNHFKITRDDNGFCNSVHVKHGYSFSKKQFTHYEEINFSLDGSGFFEFKNVIYMSSDESEIATMKFPGCDEF